MDRCAADIAADEVEDDAPVECDALTIDAVATVAGLTGTGTSVASELALELKLELEFVLVGDSIDKRST